MDLFGSSANERALDAMLLLASTYELTSDCGPKEKDELREWRGLELDGEENPPVPLGMAKRSDGGGVAGILKS